MKSALLWTLAVLLAIGAGGWLALSRGGDQAEAERPVTDQEAQMLAGLRQRNHEGDPVAVRLRFPVEGEEVVVDGYLDWEHPLLYARTAGADGEDRLVQAMPGLVATRADHEKFDRAQVPGGDWSPRQMLAGGATPDESMFDILVSSLFTVSGEREDDPAYLAEHATWREEGLVDGVPVDTFRAPILVESDGADTAAGTRPDALYSLDEDGRIRRFQVNTGGDELASVEFLRQVEFDAAGLEPIDLLGGPAIDPGEVDAELASAIVEARQANWAASATVEMRVPVGDGEVADGHGFIDWRTMTAYLNVHDADGHHLLLARPGGVAHLEVDSDELPRPLPTEGWEARALGDDEASELFGPVETMTYRLLETASEDPGEAGAVAEEASLLRVDGDAEPATYVVEFPVAGDAEAEAGESAFRYHVADGRLAEVELMTFWGVGGAELAYEDYPVMAIPWTVSDTIG
ncbi:hypothetical protein [Glycomyces xiaoerkulensis]|uniref:hypothetical protein n=1 Tax=Glycomyces xiaoerkulensis TaxID=2038139 RepID=UPI0012FFD4EE|nr:hypothetical protein [Glycomyces xiaoerkulensis]